MKRELVSKNVHKSRFNYMKHTAYYSATLCSIYLIRIFMEYYIPTLGPILLYCKDTYCQQVQINRSINRSNTQAIRIQFQKH